MKKIVIMLIVICSFSFILSSCKKKNKIDPMTMEVTSLADIEKLDSFKLNFSTLYVKEIIDGRVIYEEDGYEHTDAYDYPLYMECRLRTSDGSKIVIEKMDGTTMKEEDLVEGDILICYHNYRLEQPTFPPLKTVYRLFYIGNISDK